MIEDIFKVIEHDPILERIYGIDPEMVLVNTEFKGCFINWQLWDSCFILVTREEFEKVREYQYDSVINF